MVVDSPKVLGGHDVLYSILEVFERNFFIPLEAQFSSKINIGIVFVTRKRDITYP